MTFGVTSRRRRELDHEIGYTWGVIGVLTDVSNMFFEEQKAWLEAWSVQSFEAYAPRPQQSGT